MACCLSHSKSGMQSGSLSQAEPGHRDRAMPVAVAVAVSMAGV